MTTTRAFCALMAVTGLISIAGCQAGATAGDIHAAAAPSWTDWAPENPTLARADHNPAPRPAAGPRIAAAPGADLAAATTWTDWAPENPTLVRTAESGAGIAGSDRTPFITCAPCWTDWAPENPVAHTHTTPIRQPSVRTAYGK